MVKHLLKKIISISGLLFAVTACTGIPEGVHVIDNFEMHRYLGTWYEIARLDHPFERGLQRISAEYRLREDGGIDVLNQGQNIETQVWEQAEGVGYFIDRPTLGRLKVSFFGPFYGAYNIIALDKVNYSYAMITGPDRDYLWILSRSKQLPTATLDSLIQQAKRLAFATEDLIYVRQ